MTAAEFKRVTEVTYLGIAYGTLAALKRMRPRDQGVIIQVGSALAYRGIPCATRSGRSCWRIAATLQSAYCAAKHARPRHDGAVACAEHAAVRLGQEQASTPRRTGRHRLSTGSGGRRHRVGGRARSPGIVRRA